MSDTNDVKRNTKRIDNPNKNQENISKDKYDYIIEDLFLGEESPNKEFYQKEIPKRTIVSALEFKNIGPKCAVVFTEEVHEKILEVQNISIKNKIEASFYLFGIEKDGIIIFNQVVYNFKGNTSNSADFNSMADNMYDYLQERRNLTYNINNFKDKVYTSVLCQGHTHVLKGRESTDTFSYLDIKALIKQREIDERIHFGTRSMSMLLTPTGDYNFIYYENNDLFKGIYKYNNVFVRGKDKKLTRLPAYQNGNYLKDATKNKSK